MSRISDEDIERIADAVIRKLSKRGFTYPPYPLPVWPNPYVGDWPPFGQVWSGDIPGTVGSGSTARG